MIGAYKEILDAKYEASNRYYLKRFSDESPYDFLYYFDLMNVYPLFPSILSINLLKGSQEQRQESNKNNEGMSASADKIVEIIQGIKLNFDKGSTIKKYTEIDQLTEMMLFKIKKVEGFFIKKKHQEDKIRKLFSYEIIDYVADNYNAEYVTNAWLKCYEIVHHFNLFGHAPEGKINYFGICEQPGSFLYAINHYLRTHNKSKDNLSFNFVLESLNLPSEQAMKKRSAFIKEEQLEKTYPMVYDYGEDGTGDVTKLHNIVYYRKKYYNNFFHLISADCGEHCDELTNQERMLFPVLFGQIILALGLASKGTNYFFKLFTINEPQTREFIYLLNILFEQIHITRALQTKINSGEIYIVCTNFLFTKEAFEPLFNDLCVWYGTFRSRATIGLLDNQKMMLNSHVFQRIDQANEILLKRRIISLNFFIFRYSNYYFTSIHSEIGEYILRLVDHYTKHFVIYYDIKTLKDEDKLVEKKFESKWNRDGSKAVMKKHPTHPPQEIKSELSEIYSLKNMLNIRWNDDYINFFVNKHLEMQQVTPIKKEYSITKLSQHQQSTQPFDQEMVQILGENYHKYNAVRTKIQRFVLSRFFLNIMYPFKKCNFTRMLDNLLKYLYPNKNYPRINHVNFNIGSDDKGDSEVQKQLNTFYELFNLEHKSIAMRYQDDSHQMFLHLSEHIKKTPEMNFYLIIIKGFISENETKKRNNIYKFIAEAINQVNNGTSFLINFSLRLNLRNSIEIINIIGTAFEKSYIINYGASYIVTSLDVVFFNKKSQIDIPGESWDTVDNFYQNIGFMDKAIVNSCHGLFSYMIEYYEIGYALLQLYTYDEEAYLIIMEKIKNMTKHYNQKYLST
jgi:23S rRNA U2552 (ribose-2'-O)-methylase RlmE/FtsJ